MARTFVYKRSIDAVTTDPTFYDRLNHPVNGIKIKEEPPDPDTHDHDDSSSVSNIGATIRNKPTVLEDRLSNSMNDKEKESVLSREYADLGNRTSDLDGRKCKSLPSRKLREQEPRIAKKRQKFSRESPNIVHRRKPRVQPKYNVECDVCFSSFNTEDKLRNHKKKYASSKYICDVCKGVFNAASILIRHKQRCLFVQDYIVTHQGGRYICDFCKRKFSSKSQLQAHVFHSHEIWTTPAATEIVETKGNLLMGNTDHRVANVDADRVKDNVLEENRDNRSANNIEATEVLDNLSNSSVRELRQTTLTEFRSFFGKERKAECVDPENVSSAEKAELENSLRIAFNGGESSTDKIPFVQIHMNSNAMAVLFKDQVKTEPENDHNTPTTSHKISYNLRRILREDVDRSPVESDGELALGASNERNSIVTRKRKRENALLRERKLNLEYKCKKCVVCLERCDKMLNKGDSEVEEFESMLVDIDSIKIEENGENDRATSPSDLTLKALHVSVVRVDELVKIDVKESPTYSEEIPRLTTDEIDVSDTKAFRCKICKKSFPSKANAHEHVELFHVVYMSSICKARYASRNKLLNHYLCQHAVFNRKECCVCREKLDTPTMLKQHMVLHCIKCIRSKSYDPNNFDRETRCNAFRKRNRCNVCGKRFWLNLCLKQHRSICGRTNENREKKEQASCTEAFSSLSEERATPRGIAPSGAMTDVRWDSNCPGSSDRTNTSFVVDEPESAINSILHASPGKRSDSAIRVNASRLRIIATRESSIGSTVSANGYQIDGTAADRVKFPCAICNKQFQTFRNLCLHERTFCKPATNPCTICGTAFTTKRLLQLHALATHTPLCSPSYKYFCKFCNQGFIKKANLQVHERHFHTDAIATRYKTTWQNDERTWKRNTVCTVCNLMFESYERFIEHNKYYYKGQVFTCTFCSQSFDGMYVLHRHNKLVHYPEVTRNSYTYTCDKCNEGFGQESHFHAHKLHVHSRGAFPDETMREHNYAITSKNAETRVKLPLIAYTCNICTLYFTNETDLRMHEMEYSLYGDFQCTKCEKKCRTAAILIKHESLSHNGRGIGNRCKCRFCGEVLTTNESMMCHEKHFHGSNSALESDRNATDRLDANRGEAGSKDAVQSDNGTDNLTCLTCDTRFEDETKLKDHLLEYSDIGVYSCGICHRKFAEVHRLELHRTKHSRLNFILSEHHCPICHEGFSSAIDVRMHVLHLHGYETFPSIVIGRSNDTRDKKNSANETVSGGLKLSNASILSSTDQLQSHPFKCPECEIIFDTRSNLFRHRSRYVNNGNHVCEYCGRKFPSLVLLEPHLSKHFADIRDRSTKHKCVHCVETFRNPVSRYSHIVHVHGRDKLNEQSTDANKPIDLSLDCFKFDFNTIMSELIDDFERDRFSPSAFGKNLSEPSDGNENIERPIDERKVSPSTMVKTSSETYTIQEDGDSLEDVEEKMVRYTCSMCNLVYPTSKRFQSHFRLTHTKTIHGTIASSVSSDNENVIVCMVCGSTFAKEWIFMKHIRTVHTSSLSTDGQSGAKYVTPFSTVGEKRAPAINEPNLSKTKRHNVSDVQALCEGYFGPIIKYVGNLSPGKHSHCN